MTSKILKLADDMEVVADLLKMKGRFEGDMVKISISDLAEAIRAMRDENVKLKERLQISPEHGYDKIDGLEADVALLNNENVRLREALIRLVTCSDPFVSEIATNVLNGDYVEFRPDGKDFTVYGDDGNKTTYVRSEQEKGTDHE